MELRIPIDNRGKQFTGISRDKLGLTLMALPLAGEGETFRSPLALYPNIIHFSLFFHKIPVDFLADIGRNHYLCSK